MKSLTRKELEVMRVLWERGPSKPAEIQDELAEPVGNATLRSLLGVLLEKGHVRRSKRGKAFFYQAATSQQGVFKRMVRQLSDVFCNGSKGRLVATLVESESLSKEDVAALEKVLSERKENLK